MGACGLRAAFAFRKARSIDSRRRVAYQQHDLPFHVQAGIVIMLERRRRDPGPDKDNLSLHLAAGDGVGKKEIAEMKVTGPAIQGDFQSALRRIRLGGDYLKGLQKAAVLAGAPKPIALKMGSQITGHDGETG